MADDRDRIRRQEESDQYNARGIEAADRNWLEEAVKAFRRAIELDPESAHAHDNLARVYAQQGRFHLALEEYLEALRIEPENPAAHYNLACFLSAHGEEMAVEEYQQAIQLEYDYPDAHVNLGLCYVDMGEHEKAIAEFRIACELDPTDFGARQELAASLIDVAEYAEAIRHLKDVTKAEPDNLDAWIDLGIAFSFQGFYDQSEGALRAADIEPREVLVPYHLAALYAGWDRLDESLEQLAKAVELDPERVRAWVEADRKLDPLRDDPRLMALLR